MGKIISWVDIPSADFDRAVSFYNAVFNFQMTKNDYGNEKMAFLPNGEGSVSYAENFLPSEKGALVSFAVPDSIEKTIERIEENGGKVVQGKTKIEAEGKDYFAICLDSEGNKIGIYGI